MYKRAPIVAKLPPPRSTARWQRSGRCQLFCPTATSISRAHFDDKYYKPPCCQLTQKWTANGAYNIQLRWRKICRLLQKVNFVRISTARYVEENWKNFPYQQARIEWCMKERPCSLCSLCPGESYIGWLRHCRYSVEDTMQSSWWRSGIRDIFEVECSETINWAQKESAGLLYIYTMPERRLSGWSCHRRQVPTVVLRNSDKLASIYF